MKKLIRVLSTVAACGALSVALPTAANAGKGEGGNPVMILACTDLADGFASDCQFSGNITPDGTYSYENAEAIYNAYAGERDWNTIELNLLDEFSDANGTQTGDYGLITNNGSTGTFDFTGYDVQYVALKGGTGGFWIFEIVGDPASTGTWSMPYTADNKQQDMSHMLVFGQLASNVPEPATWAMMLIGFIGIGSQVRRRRSQMQRSLA